MLGYETDYDDWENKITQSVDKAKEVYGDYTTTQSGSVSDSESASASTTQQQFNIGLTDEYGELNWKVIALIIGVIIVIAVILYMWY